MIRNVVTTPVAVEEVFLFPPWTLKTVKNHILPSKSASQHSSSSQHAAFHELSIPHLPDMVFPDNLLKIELANNNGIEFNALDALKLVNDKEDLVKVAVAEAWKEARLYIKRASRLFSNI